MQQEVTRSLYSGRFAVQRERNEGLAVLSEIAVECFSLFT